MKNFKWLVIDEQNPLLETSIDMLSNVQTSRDKSGCIIILILTVIGFIVTALLTIFKWEAWRQMMIISWMLIIYGHIIYT